LKNVAAGALSEQRYPVSSEELKVSIDRNVAPYYIPAIRASGNAEWDSPPYLRALVLTWFDRSQDESQTPDIFDRFIFLWIAFDGWLSNKSLADAKRSGKPQTNEWLRGWIKSTPYLRDEFKEIKDKIEPNLENLVGWEIPNRLNNERRTLVRPDDFDTLIDVLYQIRNNLFHAHKLRDNESDEMLVTAAYTIVSFLLRPFVDELRTQPKVP
jgi:hypothetical protein